jgi:hypothetical protein
MICECCGQEHYDPSITEGTDEQMELFPPELFTKRPFGPKTEIESYIGELRWTNTLLNTSPWLRLIYPGSFPENMGAIV